MATTPRRAGHVQRGLSRLPTRTRARSLPAAASPGPRVCVCARNGAGGGAAGGRGPGRVTGGAAQSALASRPRRWYWGSEGAVLQNAVSGSQRGRKEPSGRKAPSPPPGPGHRAPGPGSFPPPAVAGRFVSPASALRGAREGLPRGLLGDRGGRKGGRARRDSGDPGVRPPGGPRERPRRALEPRGQGCGPGATVSRDLPVDGGRCSPRPWALRAAGASRR